MMEGRGGDGSWMRVTDEKAEKCVRKRNIVGHVMVSGRTQCLSSHEERQSA